ncbi:MAG: response regulator [Blastocatellia bacterium]|nr:response regulator [Blastocatellia bacterium]
MNPKLRVVIADDERPARAMLASMLQKYEDVDIVGEAKDGTEAIELIEEKKPDLALLDLMMPELGGLDVVRLLKKSSIPLIAFVTAYDEYAVKAFELNAIDYLLKPVDSGRLKETITRAQDRLEKADMRADEAMHLRAAITDYENSAKLPFLERIPIRLRDEIIIVPVGNIFSVVADGELLHLTSAKNERYTINYRLKELELRLDPSRFVKLGRGALVNVEAISRITPMPGGTYVVTLTNGQQLKVSRLQSKILREQLLKL